MAIETEIKLSLPAGAARRVPAHALLANSQQAELLLAQGLAEITRAAARRN